MGYTNRIFSWDFDALKRFYEKYVKGPFTDVRSLVDGFNNKLNTEIQVRMEGDNTLRLSLEEEATNRHMLESRLANEMAQVQQDIGQEATERGKLQNVVTGLQNGLEQETTARQMLESMLSNRIFQLQVDVASLSAKTGFCTLYYADGSTNMIDGYGELTQGMVRQSNYMEISSAYLGADCTSVGSDAFYECPSLESVKMGNSVRGIGSQAFFRCYGLKSIEMGIGLESIGAYAFHYCTGLTSVDIPSSVKSIGSAAFSYCSGLTSITVRTVTPPTVYPDSFGMTGDAPIYVPAESVEAYKAEWGEYSSRIAAIAS